MTDVIHRQFSIERTYPQSPSRVFRAFQDPRRKRAWFAEGPGFVVDHYELDFREGGFERTRFRFGESGPPMTNDCLYLDIQPDQRMVFAYSMTVAGQPLTASMSTIELFPEGKGTKMRFTEAIAYLNGDDHTEGRIEGTRGLFERLAQELDAQP